MIHEFKKPIPVETEHGEGYAIYVESSGMFENDVWAIVSSDRGIRHYLTNQIKISINYTFKIHEKEKSQRIKKNSRCICIDKPKSKRQARIQKIKGHSQRNKRTKIKSTQ